MKETWIQEIRDAEAGFCQQAKDQGIQEAFLAFAADEAVLNRGGQLIKGKTAIAGFFEAQGTPNYQLTWSPDFVDVAESGDLAYSYGKYLLTATDKDGKEIQSEGIFHTVWKRQSDGNWKYVYD